MEVRKNELGDVLEPLDVVGLRCRKSIADGNEKIAQVAAMVTAAKRRIEIDGEAFPGGFKHWLEVYVINPPWSVPKLLTFGGWQKAKKPGGEVAKPEAIVAKVAAVKEKRRTRDNSRNKHDRAFSSEAATPAAAPSVEPPPIAPAPYDFNLAGRQQAEEPEPEGEPIGIEAAAKMMDVAPDAVRGAHYLLSLLPETILAWVKTILADRRDDIIKEIPEADRLQSASDYMRALNITVEQLSAYLAADAETVD